MNGNRSGQPRPLHLVCPQSIQLRTPVQVVAMAQIDPKPTYGQLDSPPQTKRIISTAFCPDRVISERLPLR
jgi:hypothetical protein